MSVETTDGLLRALAVERRSLAEAQAALDQFESCVVFERLRDSAQHHVTVLTETLDSYGASVPPAPEPSPTHWPTEADALEAARRRERSAGDLYDELLNQTHGDDLHPLYFMLWRSSVHRHQPAISHHLNRHRHVPEPGGSV